MKRYMLSTLFVLIFAIGTSSATGIRVGLLGGANFSSSKTSIKNAGDLSISDSPFQPGFLVGPILEVSFTGLMVNAAALYSHEKTEQKTKYEELGKVIEFINEDKINYLKMPINIGYKFELGGIGAFLQTGPIFNVALNGEIKSKGNGQTESESIGFGSSDTDDRKRLNFDWSVGAGLNIKKFQIGLHYDFGINDVAPDDAVEFKTNNFRATIGYFFLGG